MKVHRRIAAIAAAGLLSFAVIAPVSSRDCTASGSIRSSLSGTSSSIILRTLITARSGAGVQPLWVAGSGSFIPPGPPKTVKVSLDDYEFDGIAGVNLKLTLYHFLEIEGKYQAVFNAQNYRSVVSAESRVFFARNWGVTYRFKFAQTTSTGTEIYNMIGVVFTF